MRRMECWIDTHCHLDAAEFAPDRDAVRAAARAAGVAHCVLPAVELSNLQAVRALAHRHGDSYALGIHPLFTGQAGEGDLDVLAQALQDHCGDPHLVAVGEIGLDYFLDQLDRDQQQYYFDAQLALAREFELPVIVHARRAVDAVIASLRRFAPVKGVIHSFGGSQEQARQLYQLGCMLGIGGPVTYERAQRLHRLVATMPLEHLLLETDSPDQPDSAWRGQRNEPARLPVVLDAIARLRGESREAIAAATTANAERLFGIRAA